MSTAIFVSHRHSDQDSAASLVDFLIASLDVDDSAIRATSVPGHQLPFGRSITSQLKEDIGTSAAVIALLTRDSLSSNWVVFELGASWALGKITIPVLGPGVKSNDLPGPLGQYPCVEIEAIDAHSRLTDSIAQMATHLGIQEKTGGKAQAKLNAFVAAFRASTPASEDDVRLVGEHDHKPADIQISLGRLGSWRARQIIVRNTGDGVAEHLAIWADGSPIDQHTCWVSGQTLPGKLGSGELLGVKIATSMGSPERAEIKVTWQEQDGSAHETERVVQLI